MEEQNLIGKCGLYCGACVIYRAERDSQEWRGRIAEGYNCSIEQVCCNGCGSLTEKCWGNECRIVLCTRVKGVGYCYECPEYADGGCEKAFHFIIKPVLQNFLPLSSAQLTHFPFYINTL